MPNQVVWSKQTQAKNSFLSYDNVSKSKILLGSIGSVATVLVILMIQSQIEPNQYEGDTGIIEKQKNDFTYLTIGIIDQDAVKSITQLQPTADYLAEKLSDSDVKYKGKVVVVKTSKDMIESLGNKKIDIAIDSPITMQYVADKSDAVPFLIRWKNGLANYYSIFVVKNESAINSLEEMKDKTIIFEDPMSSSAYYLPKYHLIQQGFSFDKEHPDANFIFSGDNDNTIVWLLDDHGDIAAMSNVDYTKLDDITKQKIKIIERTEEIPRNMVIHRGDLDPKMVEKMSKVLIVMNDDPLGSKIMNDFQGTTKYVKIKDVQKTLNQLRAILKIMPEEFQ